MIIGTCVFKRKDSQGRTKSYILRDLDGKEKEFTGEFIKKAIKNRQLEINNLQIDKAGRLVDRAVPYKPMEVLNNMSVLNMMTRIDKLDQRDRARILYYIRKDNQFGIDTNDMLSLFTYGSKFGVHRYIGLETMARDRGTFICEVFGILPSLRRDYMFKATEGDKDKARDIVNEADVKIEYDAHALSNIKKLVYKIILEEGFEYNPTLTKISEQKIPDKYMKSAKTCDKIFDNLGKTYDLKMILSDIEREMDYGKLFGGKDGYKLYECASRWYELYYYRGSLVENKRGLQRAQNDSIKMYNMYREKQKEELLERGSSVDRVNQMVNRAVVVNPELFMLISE